jgi:methylthioribose-1-phosphate isomerase
MSLLPIRTVAWSADGHAIRILDQSALPELAVVHEYSALEDIIDAIRTLKVRGAPAIGVAAAMGLVVAVRRASAGNAAEARQLLPGFCGQLIAARPTAVNLAWAVNRMLATGLAAPDDHEAQRIHDEDVDMCRRIGEAGLPLIKDGANILTHCNAGALATAGIGTALAPIHLAHQMGRAVAVFADETRPLRQGARLTAWELAHAGIPVTVLPDSAAASLLRDGKVDLVIVGADRIAANGDVANKIGTYPLALAAREHGIPFYVAAPCSTFDPMTTTGLDITIEHRSADELVPLPAGVSVYNPAFDITPAALVTAYVTDRGILHPPFDSRSPIGASA